MAKKRSILSSAVLLRSLFLVGWMAVIFAFSAVHGSSYPQVEPTLGYFLERKGAHVIEYAILMFLAVRFFYALSPRERLRNIVLLAAALCLLYAATDEFHQSLVPNRGAKVTDVLIDGLGIALTAFFFWAAQPPPKKSVMKEK